MGADFAECRLSTAPQGSTHGRARPSSKVDPSFEEDAACVPVGGLFDALPCHPLGTFPSLVPPAPQDELVHLAVLGDEGGIRLACKKRTLDARLIHPTVDLGLVQ